MAHSAEGGKGEEPGGTEHDAPYGGPFQVPQRVLWVGDEYNPLPRREQTRSWLAFSLVGLVAVISLALIGLTAGGVLDIDEAKDLVAGILSPLIALTGAALGFYFGGHQR